MKDIIQDMILSRKAALEFRSIPYMLKNWLNGNTENLEDTKKAQEDNDESDRQVLEMFEESPF